MSTSPAGIDAFEPGRGRSLAPPPPASSAGTAPDLKPRAVGPFLYADGRRFIVRGVTYGTFGAEYDDLLPESHQVARDFAAIAAAGFNAVRTYTEPRPEILDLAAEHRLRLLVGVWWQDPLYFGPPTRAKWSEMADHARDRVREAAARCGAHPSVLGLVVGNEIPADAVRWYGRRRVERLLRELYRSGKEGAGDCLVGYANYPTTGYLHTDVFDFDCFNVFLEDEGAFRRYLAELMVSRLDRPLLLTELGLDARTHGECGQARALDWQLRAAYDLGVAGTCAFSWTDDWSVGGVRVDEWEFGLTRADRSPKAALDVVSGRHDAGLLGCRDEWPRASVVVCAYQAEGTLGACLASLQALEYPDYEVVVVDDGSTDTTPTIASAYPVRLLSDGHGGLSYARNLGLAHATGDIVAYIDSDAYATPDWLTHLVLGLHRPGAAAVGGPNVVPPSDPPVAQAIYQAPGGPVHVLVDDEYAEHVPGCNMAYWREPLREIGGFDPVYRTAGDDADVCWKLLDRGHRIAFHPAALVWHHPRARVRGFWCQQVGYGRAEAVLARRHPDRFTGDGHARWRGRVYGPSSSLSTRARLYSGRFGLAPYQRLYGGRPVPLVFGLYLVGALAALALLWPVLVLPLVAAVAALGGVFAVRGMRAARRAELRPAVAWSVLIGVLHVLQPVAREVGRRRARGEAHEQGPAGRDPVRARPNGHRMLVVAEASERESLLLDLRCQLGGAGLQVEPDTGWRAADLTIRSGPFWQARLTSNAVAGAVYLRLVHRPRLTLFGAVTVVALGAVTWPPVVAAVAGTVLVTLAGLELARLVLRTRRALAGKEAAR